MPEIVVAAEKRTETGKNVNRRLRIRGLIPGVLYGAKSETTPVSVSPKEIGAILRSATGENTLFDLDLGGRRRRVILKEFHVEPTGVPVGVKVQGGILDFVTRELEVECLPTDIPEKIVVDVSELELGKH